MKYKILGLLFFICSYSYSQYVTLSSSAEVSVITIGPGTSLNDSFGHNGFRIQDQTFDIVFDYGRYDFDAPNFYTKFAQGKLNYKMGVGNFNEFKTWYIGQNRTIREQVLNLSQDDKQRVFNFLATNSEPENTYYLYDFFYDNCATKIRDVLVDGLDTNIKFNDPKSFEKKNFRTLIQDNLDWNSWGSFGIDLALGSVIDKQAASIDHMFLPDYIHAFFESASIQNNPEKSLVKSSQVIYSKTESSSSAHFLKSPLFIFGLIGLLIIYMTFRDYKNKRRSKWLDFVLFTVTGIIGAIILLLWFATDHSATAHNYNLLWAFALNIFVVFQTLKRQPKSWFIKYIKLLAILIVLMSLHWVIGIQKFALVLIPLLIALFARYMYLIRYYGKQ